jgi:hypothetical protein
VIRTITPYLKRAPFYIACDRDVTPLETVACRMELCDDLRLNDQYPAGTDIGCRFAAGPRCT